MSNKQNDVINENILLTREDVANEIVNWFFKKGATVSKIDFDFVLRAINFIIIKEKYMNLSTINQQSEESLSRSVFESLGQASMCWSEIPKGTFASDEASIIGQDLVKTVLAQTKKDLDLFLAEILPEKEEVGELYYDENGIDREDGGAWWRMGKNVCLDEIKQRVEKFMNN